MVLSIGCHCVISPHYTTPPEKQLHTAFGTPVFSSLNVYSLPVYVGAIFHSIMGTPTLLELVLGGDQELSGTAMTANFPNTTHP